MQVHAHGFEKNQSLAKLIEDPAPITDQLAAEPMVKGFTSRVRVSGLASSAGGNAGAHIFAIEPEREKAFSHVERFLRQGRWLSDKDDHAVLLGEGLADRLRVSLGDKIVMMVVLNNGDIASEVFRLRGILHSGVMDIDNNAAIIPLATGQRWLDLEGGVTDIAVYAQNIDALEPLVTRLHQQYLEKGLEVLSWSDIDPTTEQMLQFTDTSSLVILSVVIVVVIAEVMNTMLMSMHERTRELGMMAAMGVTQRQIFAMILWETLILVVVGSILGFLLGAWASVFFGERGIDLSHYADAFSFTYMESIVHPELSLDSVRDILGAAIIGALVAGLFPAWRAARLEPAIAIRKV